MAKFKFRLQSFFELKEKIEEQKKVEYGKSLARLEYEKKKKAALEKEKNDLVDSFRESIYSKIEPRDFLIYNDYIEVVKKRIVEQEKTVLSAEADAEAKRFGLVEAMKERKTLETLRDNEHEEYIKSEKIAEQKVLDEIVSYRYNNQER